MELFTHDDHYTVDIKENGEYVYNDKISHTALVGRAKGAARTSTGNRHWELESIDYCWGTFEDERGIERPICRTILKAAANPKTS